jgi:AcrR family transcriptional regulator
VTKTLRTRAALLVAALELFEERGYDATTAASIAERAGVTEMTFFRHFVSKDAVLIADPYDPLIAEAVLRQPLGASPLIAAIRGVADAWVSVPAPVSEDVRQRLRIVARTPSLRGALARNSADTENAIAEALERRGAASPEARIAASATVAALNAALLDWAEGEDPDLGTAIDGALRVLQGGATR